MFDIINKLRKKWHVPEIKKDEKTYSSFTFPLVKNVYPSLVSNQINIQPMRAPSNTIFTTQYTYGTSSFGTISKSKPVSTQGSDMHEILIKDILNNWENMESILFDIPQIDITLNSVPITTQTRKLKSIYTLQKPKTVFGID